MAVEHNPCTCSISFNKNLWRTMFRLGWTMMTDGRNDTKTMASQKTSVKQHLRSISPCERDYRTLNPHRIIPKSLIHVNTPVQIFNRQKLAILLL